MRFVSQELVGYKRMQLNGMSYIHVTFNELVQQILGTNGSGKSSFLYETSVLPADPSNYTKDGSKTTKVRKNGETYTLRSWFSPKNQHSIVRESDGEELNPGHTITVQKEVVKQIFGVDAAIHELIQGRDKFTEMTSAQRRVWFTRLSDISYDYALAVYQKLKDHYRDTTGALKRTKKRLVDEQAKVISEDEERRLTLEVKDLSTELNLLQSQRAPVNRPSASYKEEIREGMEELTRMSMRLLRTRIIAPYGVHPERPLLRDEWYEMHRPTFHSVQDITDYITQLEHDTTVKQSLINKEVSVHEKIKETVRVLERTGAEGVKALLAQRDDLQAQRVKLLKQSALGLECAEPREMARALDAVETQLVDIFSELPANEDKLYTQAKLQEVEQTILRLKDELRKKTAQLTFLQSQKTHLEAHKNSGDLTCPKCSHKWIVGYTDEKFKELEATIANAEAALEPVKREIEQSELLAQQIRDYGQLYRSYVRTTQSFPVLRSFWDHLQNENYVVRAPKMVLTALATFKQDLQLEVDAAGIAQKVREVEELIKQAEQVGDANLSDQQLRLAASALEIETLTASLNETTAKYREFTHWRRQLVEAEELSRQIVSLEHSLTSTNAAMVEALRLETLNHCIQQVRHSLVRKEETLSAVTLHKAIIADLEKNVAALEVQEEAAKALVKALSPTDGLIAEGLLGFIRSFTKQMNTQIRKIWTYPLQVQDCASEGDTAELDYQFPLMVQTKDNVVSDVSKGSTGMQEIVNLAFRVTAMRYLGLAEAPLYLDEFGASFDVAHRSQATAAIKALMEQQQFTQLFMVSHYEATHGAFSNPEVCVICPNNITIPASTKYNQHVVIR